MRVEISPVAGLLYGAGLAVAQGYADNQLPTVKDEPRIAANFPDVDIELFSPAFIQPETIPIEFENGTAGPTDQDILGGSSYSKYCYSTGEYTRAHLTNSALERGVPSGPR